MGNIFGTLSFMAAALSAHLWFRASKIPTPPHTGDNYAGEGPFSEELRQQSSANAKAAFVAAVAALFGALAMGIKVTAAYFGWP